MFTDLPVSAFLPPLAYLFGSISSAVIVCRALRLPDPRSRGSHNPGATNVLRIGGGVAKRAAAITLAGDFLKGLLPVLFALALNASSVLIALTGLCAFLGHLYPIWFGFRGGKGVAVAAGVFAGLSLTLAGLLFAAWLALALMFRYSSLAALGAAALAPPLVAWLLPAPGYTPMSLCMVALLFWRHRENIRRLINGEEGKIKLRSQK